MIRTKKFITLVILDGWGIAPPTRGNAITLANIPNFNELVKKYKVFALQASGELVGLPWGEMGNSEVGHLALGCGRIIYQSLPRVTRAITDHSFFKNPAFLAAFEHIKKNQSALHLIGLVSDGGVHSLNEHLYALLELAGQQQVEKIFIHVILDGRDTARDVGEIFVAQLREKIANLGGVGRIATISGRYYAMDRDNRWDRTEKAYRTIVEGKSEQVFSDPILAIRDSYEKQVYDEEFMPTVIVKNGQPVAKINKNDAVIFFNFRPDRVRQLTKALILPGFAKFERSLIQNLFFVSMTEYEKDLPVSAIAFGPQIIKNSLAEVLSRLAYRQLHIAETEKYPHVTFFFNGGREKAFPGEERILIPSPSVASYDQKPKMSIYEIKERLVTEIKAHQYDFIVANFANADMVGHTGHLKPAVLGIEAIDACLGEITEIILEMGGKLIVTADHGNVEEMINQQTGEISKEHSANPVPCIFVANEWAVPSGVGAQDLCYLKPAGFLADVAPTILKLYGIEKPAEMTGRALF